MTTYTFTLKDKNRPRSRCFTPCLSDCLSDCLPALLTSQWCKVVEDTNGWEQQIPVHTHTYTLSMPTRPYHPDAHS